MVDLIAAMSLSLYCNDPLERTTWLKQVKIHWDINIAAELSMAKLRLETKIVFSIAQSLVSMLHQDYMKTCLWALAWQPGK